MVINLFKLFSILNGLVHRLLSLFFFFDVMLSAEFFPSLGHALVKILNLFLFLFLLQLQILLVLLEPGDDLTVTLHLSGRFNKIYK